MRGGIVSKCVGESGAVVFDEIGYSWSLDDLVVVVVGRGSRTLFRVVTLVHVLGSVLICLSTLCCLGTNGSEQSENVG